MQTQFDTSAADWLKTWRQKVKLIIYQDFQKSSKSYAPDIVYADVSVRFPTYKTPSAMTLKSSWHLENITK